MCYNFMAWVMEKTQAGTRSNILNVLCLFPFSFLPDSLCSVLWNLYHYYKQFLDPVQAKIVELRSPIEKELKVRLVTVIITLERTKSARPFL